MAGVGRVVLVEDEHESTVGSLQVEPAKAKLPLVCPRNRQVAEAVAVASRPLRRDRVVAAEEEEL